MTFLGFEWGAFFEGLTSCLEEQTKTYNWLNQNCYDKTIKTTISFYICLFFYYHKTKTNTKNKCKIQQLFSNVLIPTTTTTTPQHQQPTTNKLKKKTETANKKKTNKQPSTNHHRTSLAGNQNKPLDRN